MADRTFERVTASDVERWLLAHPQALILDARDAASHAAGHIEGSIRIDGRNHEPMLLQSSRTRAVFIYCYRGNASQTYAQQFSDFGFRDVADMVGGWEAYQKSLQPVTHAADNALQPWLLANGFVDINAAGKHGNTPLMHAAWKGDTAMVDTLLAAGARVDPVNNDGNTALWLACVSNDAAIVKRIAAAGAALDHGNATSATCLMYAASSSKPDIVATLLDLGADPFIESQDGFSALDMAASIECLRLLRTATQARRTA